MQGLCKRTFRGYAPQDVDVLISQYEEKLQCKEDTISELKRAIELLKFDIEELTERLKISEELRKCAKKS